MDALLEGLWSSAQDIVRRLTALLGDNPPQTLRLTGVLGIAVLLLGMYHRRGGANPGSGNNRLRQREGEAGQERAGSQKGDSMEEDAALSPLAAAVRSRFRGIRRVTISCPGVLLQQRSPSALQDGAELQEGLAVIMNELADQVEVFLLAYVEDDIGEATVSGALEACGITGTKAGQIKPHRVLFCGTLDGKISLVRQLEPDMHIDSEASTVHDLQRFVPQLLHLAPAGQAGPSTPGPNVITSTSFSSYIGYTAS